MTAQWIDYKGKKVLFIDYTKARTEEEMIRILHSNKDAMTNYPKGALVRMLVDMTNAYTTQRFLDAAKQLEIDLWNEVPTKRAILGVVGIKRIILQGFNAISRKQSLKPFDTREQALEYLVAD